MSEQSVMFPAIGSHWIDTTGEDGELVVDDYHKGYVVASGADLPNGEAIIQPGWFGTRYRAMEVRVVKTMDFKGTDAQGNPMFVVTDAEWRQPE